MKKQWLLPMMMSVVVISGCAQKEELHSVVTLNTTKVMASNAITSVSEQPKVEPVVKEHSTVGNKQAPKQTVVMEEITEQPQKDHTTDIEKINQPKEELKKYTRETTKQEPKLDEIEQVVLTEEINITSTLFEKLEEDMKALAIELESIHGSSIYQDEAIRESVKPLVKEVALKTVTPAFYDKYMKDMHLIVTCSCDIEPLYRNPNFRLKAETDFVAKNRFGIKTMTNGSFLSDRQVQNMTVYVTRVNEQWYLDDLELDPTLVKLTKEEAQRDLEGLGYTKLEFEKESEVDKAYIWKVVSPMGEEVTFYYYYHLGSA